MSQARRSQKRRATQGPEAEPTQSTDVEIAEDESTPPLQGLTQATRTSKLGHLARNLLHASSNEKDGALKDVVAQKQHFFSKREYSHVLREASNVLQRSFGCKVIHRANQSHIVRIEPMQECSTGDTMAQAKRGLLSAILMFIFLSKSRKSNVTCITEAMLQNFLKSLGLSYDTPDAVFGDIKKLISPFHTAEFIHNGYISFAKSSDRQETQVITYDWGPRATLVCEPKTIITSFCSMIKDPEVDMWEDQVETVKQLEEERRQIWEGSEKYLGEER